MTLYADNLTYGAGIEGKVNKRMTGDMETAKITLYETPLQSQDKHSETEYEVAGSTYAVPNVYEYATFGPDKMVINIVILVMAIVLLVESSNS